MPRHVNACVFDPVVDERIAWGSSIPIKCRKTLLRQHRTINAPLP